MTVKTNPGRAMRIHSPRRKMRGCVAALQREGRIVGSNGPGMTNLLFGAFVDVYRLLDEAHVNSGIPETIQLPDNTEFRNSGISCDRVN